MEEKKAVVLKTMKDAGKPVRPGDIAKATGIDCKEVSKLIRIKKRRQGHFSQSLFLGTC